MHGPWDRDPGAPADTAAAPLQAVRVRARLLGAVERRGTLWEAQLEVREDGGRWRGRVLFRARGIEDPAQVGTTDIFLEAGADEIEARAASLGQPLLGALLDSALHTWERKQAVTEDVRQWFRKLLARNSSNLIGEARTATTELSLSRLRSLHDSYRLDQVGHLIALLAPDDFRACVERLLNGRAIDFRAGDRLQLAMIVVDELERRLPLPPFEVWVEDYLARPEVYQAYTDALHNGETLP